MTTTGSPTCGRCDRPVADQAYVCATCAELLAAALAEVPVVATDQRLLRSDESGPVARYWTEAREVDGAGLPVPLRPGETLGSATMPWEGSRGDAGGLAAELVTSYARQSRSGGGQPVGKAAERPVPWDDRASAAGAVLRSTLAVWARLVAEERGDDGLDYFDEPASLAGWLLDRVEWIRHRPDGAAAVDELVHAVGLVRHAVDRRADAWYAGRCGAEVEGDEGERWCCLADLYVRHGAKQVTCRHCGKEWSVEDRRKWLLAAAEETLLTGPEIARAVTALGQPVNEDLIRQWKHRGRLVPHGADERGRSLYLVGDVVNLLVDDARALGQPRSEGRHAAASRSR
ncbi:MAG: hypothetical protein ACJ74O_13590 [Frankiaceae bacterium]